MTTVLILFAVADGVMMAAAMLKGFQPGLALLLHLVLSLLSLTLWWRSGRARRFAPALGMALGPIAIVLSIMSPPIGKQVRRGRLMRARPDDATGIPAQPSGTSNSGNGGAMVARLLDGRVRHPEPQSLGSMIGVLRNGGVDDRRGALEAAVRSFDPRLSSIVAKALTDDDQTIRALAAAAASRLAQRLAEDRLALADAVTTGEHAVAERLRALLTDHSRFDVLLSEPQRDQIAKEVGIGVDRADDAAVRAEEERLLLHALKESWKAQDFEAVDLLCRKVAADDRLDQDPTWVAARWWAAQPCS